MCVATTASWPRSLRSAADDYAEQVEDLLDGPGLGRVIQFLRTPTPDRAGEAKIGAAVGLTTGLEFETAVATRARYWDGQRLVDLPDCVA